MNTRNFILVLITMGYMSLPFSVFGDDNIGDSQSFSERIVTLQTETRYLCTNVEEKLLVATKRFTKLMQDAHIYCPDIKEMGISLANVEAMANTYYSFVTEQLGNCQELSKMLMKGLENGGLVVYYLQEGNYSLVTSIIDRWHESFTKFHATFYLTDTPLEIMLKNKKIFYYDNWLEDKIQSIFRLGLLIVGSVALSSILVWIVSTVGIVAVLSQIFKSFRRFYTILIVMLAVVLITATWVFRPTTISFSRSMRHDWYPDATTTLETISVNRDYLQSNLSRQILSIEELQHHASMYHDETIQANVDDFIHTLGEGIRQVSKELAEVYVLNEKLPSTLRRAKKSIEAQATKIGKLSEVNGLLAELTNSANRYESFQRTLQTSVIHQQKVLPTLKKQTQSIQALVREGSLVEIGRIINHHQDTLIDIDGTIYKVHIQLSNFIQIISDEHIDGMKKIIESLSNDSVTDQLKVMITGIAGTTTTTFMGVLAIKTGYAIVAVTTSVVAGPALGVASVVGGIGMMGFGGYWAVNKFDQYKELSHFQNELAALETERMRLQVAMEKVQEGITAQQESLKSSQSSLRKIADHCGQFSRIPGFTLNKNQRSAINDELLNAITEYNRMMAVYSLFTENMDHNDKALPPA